MSRHCFVLLALAATLALPGTARAYHLADSLRGSSTGTAEGGSFGPGGWTVTAPTDRIWFAIPTASSGSIEWSLTNVTTASLFPADNDIFNMYDDAGIGEPIAYRPEFVEDNYKVWLRIRTEPGLVGMQKLTVGLCPDSASSHNAVCPCGTGFVQEVTGGNGAWDGTTQRMRIEWGSGLVRFLRNGAEVDRVDYGSTGFGWGPRDLHFSFGSTRSRAVPYSGMPVGAVFSDLVVDTIDGPVASCPMVAMPDAGMPVDAGMCTAAAGVLAASADVTAASWTTGVYALPGDLNVEADASGMPTGVVYLRFPPVVGAVTRATLAVHTQADPSSGGGSGQPCRVDSDAWNETTLTWSTRPVVSATCAGTARTVGLLQEVTWDVTPLIASSGNVNLAVVSHDADGAHFYSRESGGCALGPRLYVQLVPSGDAGALADGSAMDAGTARDGGGAMDSGTARDGGDAGTDGGSHSRPLSSGCSCRAGRGGGGGGLLLLLSLLALNGVRRRASNPSAPGVARSAD